MRSSVDHATDSKMSVLPELELTALLSARSAQDNIALNFLSAGSYNNFLPAIVKAEQQCLDFAKTLSNKAADNVIQNIGNQLSAVAETASWYVFADDYITLLANLLIFCHRESTQFESQAVSKVLIPATVSPVLRQALRSQLKYQDIDLVIVDYDKISGCISLQQLEQFDDENILAVVFGWPNFFGLLEEITLISQWANNRECQLIGLSNPLSLSVLSSPFELTDGKLDYLLGDLQGSGLAVNQSGISASFLASRQAISGELKSYLRSQKYNRKLSFIDAYLSQSGISGLTQSANKSNQNLNLLVEKLCSIDGVSKKFTTTAINECVIEIAQIDIEKALKILAGHNMVFGYLLQHEFPELANCVLIYCSDQHTQSDIEKVVKKVETVVKNLSTAGCPVKPKFNV